MEPIARESLDELREIFSWINDREMEEERPVTVLVGGWAVHSYNSYWGSVDIDIITNNKTKKRLKKYLLDKRDYHPDPETTTSVFKVTSAGDVIIDLANRGRDKFEGRSSFLYLGVIDGNTEYRTLKDQEVPVPSRTVLLMMKIKAAWDRCWRIENGRSSDPDWENGKLIKDRSDILALIDPDKGGSDIRVDLMGVYFQQHPFLMDVIDRMIASNPASEKYGISPDKAVENINRFKDLILP